MIQSRPADTNDLDRVLLHVLATSGQSDSDRMRHVQSFREHLDTGRIRWIAEILEDGSRFAATGFVMLPAGGTAILMLPDPDVCDMNCRDLEAVSVRLLDRLRDSSLFYAQILLHPERESLHALARRLRFRHLSRLWYLERAQGAAVMESGCATISWREFDAANEHLFTRVLERTYLYSLDCPQLTGLRPTKSVIDGHRAVGRFDPSLWQLALIDGLPAGCCLLSRLNTSPMLEVTYMGVDPDFRNRGVGAALLRRAIELSEADHVRHLTLVVDAGNAPAIRLYARFGFRQVAQRDAYILPLEFAVSRPGARLVNCTSAPRPACG